MGLRQDGSSLTRSANPGDRRDVRRNGESASKIGDVYLLG